MRLNVKPEHGNRLANELYTAAQLKDNYAAWFDRWTKKLGRTEADFGKLSVFVNEWQNAGYSTSSLGPMNPLASVVDIDVPEGLYLVNYILDYGYADYTFGGTFVYYPGNGSTNIGVWHEKWMAGTARDLFRHAMHGTDLTGSYAESFTFRGVRLLGNAAKGITADPSFKSTGLAVWDAGETSRVMDIYAEGFNNIGIDFIRGTPTTTETLTAFNNCDAGIMLTGTAGNTFNHGTISGDDNGALLEMRAGWGRQAGGQVDIDCMKSEAGVTPISRNPHRKQKLMVLRGQFGVNVGVARGSHSQVRVDNLIEVDCRLTDGNKQVSNLVIGSINGFNYGNAVKDLANGWEAADLGDYNCYSLQYTSHNGGQLFNPFHTFAKVGGGTTNPPTNPPVNPPTTGTVKYTVNRTAATTSTTKEVAPATLGTVTSVKLVNLKLSSVVNFTWINSALFIGQDGALWVSANGTLAATGIKPTAGMAINATIPIGSALTHTIGGAGATAIFTGQIEHY